MPHILSEENREIQEMAREFAEAKIRPVSKRVRFEGETPLSVYKEAPGWDIRPCVFRKSLEEPDLAHLLIFL